MFLLTKQKTKNLKIDSAKSSKKIRPYGFFRINRLILLENLKISKFLYVHVVGCTYVYAHYIRFEWNFEFAILQNLTHQ